MKRKTIALIIVLISTLFTASAQILFSRSHEMTSIKLGGLISLNVAFLIGLLCYGISAAIFFVSIKLGDLSTVFPIYSLGYVWVAIFAVLFLQDIFNITKGLGLVTVILGVIFISRG